MNRILALAATILVGLVPFAAKAQVVTPSTAGSSMGAHYPVPPRPVFGPAPLIPIQVPVSSPSPAPVAPAPVVPVAAASIPAVPGPALAPYVPVSLPKGGTAGDVGGPALHTPSAGTPILGGLVTMVEAPEAPMGTGITIAHD